MVAKIIARKSGNDIIINKDSFELILTALASQKFVNETPPNGDALDMGKGKYNKAQRLIQKDIDDIYNQSSDILHGEIISKKKSFLDEIMPKNLLKPF